MTEGPPFIDGRSIRLREKDIAANSDTSTLSYESARPLLGLPEDVTGLTIVDLAAGASSLTAGLLENGATAYAFDQLYRDPRKLPDAIEHGVRKALLNLPKGHRREYQEKYHITAKQFLESYKKNPDHYLGGWLTNLPWSDNFADWVISINGISGLGRDYELLLTAALEAIRISKSGGQTIIAPLHTLEGYHKAYSENHQRLVEDLSTRNVGEIIVEPRSSLFWDSKLKVIKA